MALIAAYGSTVRSDFYVLSAFVMAFLLFTIFYELLEKRDENRMVSRTFMVVALIVGVVALGLGIEIMINVNLVAGIVWLVFLVYIGL